MAKKSRKPVSKSSAMWRDTWGATVETLTAAEEQVQRQIRLLMKRNKIGRKEASVLLKDLGTRWNKERARAAKELESRLKTLQTRVKKERKALAGLAEDAVHRTLAALNIPSRQEVANLTRKVEELSRKIDRLKRR